MTVAKFKYNPGQPRDDDGKWTDGGGGSGGQTVSDAGGGDSAAAARSLGESVPPPSRESLLGGFDPVPETEEIENTLLKHMDADGNISAERLQVHDELIDEALTQPATLPPDDRPNPKAGEPFPKSDKKKALVMGGGAASGKSSAIAEGFVDAPEDAVTVNPDEFKIVLPESKGPSSDGKQGDGLADEYGPAWASITHEESSHLGKRLIAAALDRETNILVDKTSSDGPKAVKEIQRLQAAGYDVEVAYVTTDVDNAVNAALARQKETGRAVPEPVLRAGHNGANAAFIDVVTQTTAPAKLVTTLPKVDGVKQAPILTAVADDSGGVVVHDRAAWDAYVARTPAAANVPVSYLDDLAERDAIAAAGGVASTATMGLEGEKPMGYGVMSEDRIKVLYGAAMTGKRPDDLTDDEATFYDDLVADLDRMKKAGVAPDFPINDVFVDSGIVAVGEGRDATTPPRKFKAPKD